MEFLIKNTKSCLKALNVCINSVDANQTIPYISNCAKTPVKARLQTTGNNKSLKKQIASAKLQFASFDSETNNNSQIDYSNISNSPFLYTTPEKMKRKLTSTVIQANSSMLSSDLSEITEVDSDDENRNAYSNNTYYSPLVTATKYGNNATQLHSANASHLDMSTEQHKDRILVCLIRYEAKKTNEISVEFSDRVKLIHETEDFYLVQNITNSLKLGYVPKYCLISINQFMNDIKYLKL